MAGPSRTDGAMHSADVVRPHHRGLSIGGSDRSILGLIAHLPGGTRIAILRAGGALNSRFVFMFILLGDGALIFHSYDAQRILISIVFGWFVPDALLLGYRGGRLWRGSLACSLHISAVQTMTCRFDFGIAGTVASCPPLSGWFRVFGDIETDNGAGDVAKERHACCGCLAECNQCCKAQDCASHHHESTVKRLTQQFRTARAHRPVIGGERSQEISPERLQIC
jgi:hypothetical protein